MLPGREQFPGDLTGRDFIKPHDVPGFFLIARRTRQFDNPGHVPGQIGHTSLGDTGIRPQRREIKLFLGGNGRENDKEDPLQMGHVPDNPAQLFAADVGHYQIDKNDVRHIGLQDIQGAQAILGGTHLMPLLLQQIGNELEHQGMVINNEDFLAHIAPVRLSC